MKMLKNLKEEQESDNYIKSLRNKLENKEKSTTKRFTIINDLLCQGDLNGTKRIMVPEKILDLIISEIHEIYVHIGSQKIYKMLREKITGKYMKKKIKQYCKTCEICQKVKYLNKRYNAIYQPIIIDKPKDLLSVDFYGPLPTSTGGVKYLLTTIDVFSKYVHIYSIRRATTHIAIKKIFEH